MEHYKKFLTEEICEDGQLKNVHFHADENYNFGFDVVDHYASVSPDKTAMVWVSSDNEERVFSFADISKNSNKAVNYFKSLGIEKGDKVMLVLRRHYEFWYIVVALHKLGAVVVPATDQLKEKDFKYRFDAADVKALIITTFGDSIVEAEKALDHCPQVKIKMTTGKRVDGWECFNEDYLSFSDVYNRPTDGTAPKRDELMLMFFTSGTTAYPKIAAHEHSYSLSHFVTAKWWHNVMYDGIHFTVAETGWGKAVWGKLYGQWLTGSAIFTYDFDRFNQETVLDMIDKHKITTFCAPPTIYRFLIKADLTKHNLSSLKYITTAGEALNPEVFEQFKSATGLSIMEGFGQTETTLTIANLKNSQIKPGSMGRPVPIYDLMLVDGDDNPVAVGDVGEICIDISKGRPYGLFREYYANSTETERAMHDGLYHTGDMAWQDEDGYLYFVGRTDDIIKSSGYRIGPFEIESVLMEHPSVLECAVIGVPDPTRGQVVKATIVLANGFEASESLKKEIQQYVKHATAPYKYPRIIEFTSSLPKTISGKIKRTDLRKNS